eukprot:scaffold57271_cov58-Phaeocystis_antarctica.AAC.2
MGVGVGVRRRGAAVAMARTRGGTTAPNVIAAAAMTMLDRVWGGWDGGGVTLPKSGDQRRALPLAWRRGAALVSRGLMRSSFWLMSP